jgi:hypothetical protein
MNAKAALHKSAERDGLGAECKAGEAQCGHAT